MTKAETILGKEGRQTPRPFTYTCPVGNDSQPMLDLHFAFVSFLALTLSLLLFRAAWRNGGHLESICPKADNVRLLIPKCT